MRRAFLLAPVLAVGALVPTAVFAQSRLGTIIPQEGICTCPGSAPDWGCIIQILQNTINIAITVGVMVIVLAIAYAGFVFMTAGSNAERRVQGRNVLLNSVLGLAIMLVAWIGVDFVMKAVYNPEATLRNGQNLGPWNDILAPTGSDMCLQVTQPLPITGGEIQILYALRSGTLQGGVGVCSPTELKAAAAQGGVTMPDSEAAVIACMAGPESACGANARENYCWNKSGTRQCPRASTAYGPYQILLKGNARHFENQACYRAAGVSGPLNCASAFTNSGHPIAGPTLERCKRAAANFTCSAVAAHGVYQEQGARAWSGNRDSTSAHRACTIRGQ